jgi:hypothetical protein
VVDLISNQVANGPSLPLVTFSINILFSVKSPDLSKWHPSCFHVNRDMSTFQIFETIALATLLVLALLAILSSRKIFRAAANAPALRPVVSSIEGFRQTQDQGGGGWVLQPAKGAQTNLERLAEHGSSISGGLMRNRRRAGWVGCRSQDARTLSCADLGAVRKEYCGVGLSRWSMMRRRQLALVYAQVRIPPVRKRESDFS